MAYIGSIERMGIEKGIIQGLAQGREEGLQTGLQTGLQKGLQEGEVTLLFRQITHKFGKVPAKYEKQIKQADAETLLVWGERVLDAKTIQEVFI